MIAFESEPRLTSEDVGIVLAAYAKIDKDGQSPNAAEWIPTYNLNAAASEAWRWKAAKASELISVDLDGERMSSNQVFEHCERMARMYSRKLAGTLTTDAR